MANAFANPDQVKGYDADSAISKYRAVKGGTAAESVAPVTAITDLIRGVSMFAVLTADLTRGKGCTVVEGGICEWEAGAAIAKDTLVTIDSVGRCVSASETYATLLTGVVGSNNAITWTAKQPGTGGNSISIALVDPGGATATQSVDVNQAGTVITVSLARASSAITSTAQQIIDAIEAHGDASELVDAANTTTSTGAGIVAAVASTPLATGTGGGAGRRVYGVTLTAASTSGDIVAVNLEVPGYPLAS